MAITKEGAKSEHVLDADKLTCPYCGGVEIMLSSVMDDPQNIQGAAKFAALGFNNNDGTDIQGLVGLCVHCGTEWVPYWWLLDIGTANGTVVMTNLDVTVADVLDGLFAIPLYGTDKGDYFVIASHTVATPTTLTFDVAASGDEDELWMITNLLPVGVVLHA